MQLSDTNLVQAIRQSWQAASNQPDRARQLEQWRDVIVELRIMKRMIIWCDGSDGALSMVDILHRVALRRCNSLVQS